MIKKTDGRKRARGAVGKTLRAAENIMHESVNELLRVRKTGGGDKRRWRERSDRGTGKKQGGKARWNSLEKCRVTSGNCEDF